ncbi:hypothetical protein [Mesorhizobium sp. B2-3-12]|uniref:hypothetical protein n=1 Tax=Mesorhizobium sp. B2-3-12 TaxID=2589952 RepID=UPI0011292AEC|nr:hypothetical protein [Mesorhizobium sp. B2-3-12]TPL93675.1 hypothetical protein FJ948_07345 [Mesorhizobium sp. B2-3-12]
MAVKIDYRLDDAGWADCDVAIDSKTASVEASYVGDALRDLVQATLAIVDGAPYAVARFLDEPGECRFVLEPQGNQTRVRLLSFPETWSEEPDGAGAVRLDAMCLLREFAEAVLTATRTILSSHGLQNYRERWGHEFPWDAVYKLDSALQRAVSDIG